LKLNITCTTTTSDTQSISLTNNSTPFSNRDFFCEPLETLGKPSVEFVDDDDDPFLLFLDFFFTKYKEILNNGKVKHV